MSISGLRNAGETYAKRYARLTMVSVAVAAVLTAVVGAASTPGRFAMLPARLSIPPTAAVFVQWFGLCFAVGLVGRMLSGNLEALRAAFAEWIGNPLCDRWSRLARRTQAVCVGVCCGIVSGGIVAVGVLYYGFPNAAVAATILATWPLGTYWLLSRRPTTVSNSERSAVRLRYVTLKHLETRTIAVLFGYLFASAVGSGLWLLGVELRWAGVVGLVVWIVSTVVVYNRYASTLQLGSELLILETYSRENGQVELVVQNDGREMIDLTGATITDTRTSRYHLTDSLRLSPADCATLRLPASFTVAPTDAERTLPLGYTLNRSQPTPVVYTWGGDAFELSQTSTETGETFVDPTPTYTTSSTAIGAGTHSHE